MSRRTWALLATVALAVSACAGAAGDDGASPTAAGVPSPAAARTCIPADEVGPVVEDAPTDPDATFPWERDDPTVLAGFDAAEIVSGGPPPDGILPIDEPCFDTVPAADEWLQDQSPVLVVEVGGDRRAYPLAILTQHEIVNDVVGGEPLVVTYCPLCNSAITLRRTVDGRVLDFGTSGRLYRSNLVMYDRQTRTLWTQFTGQAVVGGDLVGTELERVPTALLAWEEFRDAAPDGVVLSRDSVPGRDYGRNPYPGYEGNGDAFLFRGPRNPRLPPNTRVVGLGADGDDPVAVTLDLLRDERVVDIDPAGAPVTVWWAPGQASAVDTAVVDQGRDVGSTAAFVPVLSDGTQLAFAVSSDDPSRFVDDRTGSTWDLFGEAVAGELAGTRLRPVARDDTFWFVWFAFQPDTVVVGGTAGTDGR
jgi:hypothetical protein